jgi:hypothetical protein
LLDQGGRNLNLQALIAAFLFKSLASGITIYTVNERTAIEVAPAASELTSAFGVVPASIIVNVVWLSSTLGALYLIEKILHAGRTKQVVLRLALIFVIVPVAFDSLWDLGVLLRFSELYLVSILTLTALILCSYGLRQSTTQETSQI